ncbi:hypothetical protein A6763_20175 [Aeromonas caviae]|nr:hypothetical protein A6763_20175 [Aeromonas caviae]
MAKSKIQFQKGYSLFEFLKDYGTEAQCENALFTWRFPNGFVCPECANKTCCRLRVSIHQDGVDGISSAGMG